MTTHSKQHDAPAFPILGVYDNDSGHFVPVVGSNGLTKREYFAGLVIQGMMAHKTRTYARQIKAEYFAEHAVRVADALLDELEKTNG